MQIAKYKVRYDLNAKLALRRICRHRIYRGDTSAHLKCISAVYTGESSRDVVVACDWLEAIGDVIDDVVHRRRLCWLLGALNY